MKKSLENIQDLISFFESTLKENDSAAVCHKFRAGKALQIQMHGDTIYSLNIIKQTEKTYTIKRQ